MLPFVLSLPDPNSTLEVATTGLQPHILKMLQPVDAAVPAPLDTAAQAIGRIFAEASIPEEIERAIRAGYETLGACPPLSPLRQLLLLCVPRPLPRICREPPSPTSERPTSTSGAQMPSWKLSRNARHR